jgi:hypothetical protein
MEFISSTDSTLSLKPYESNVKTEGGWGPCQTAGTSMKPWTDASKNVPDGGVDRRFEWLK